MEDLKFPVIKEPLPAAKWLSMEDYIKFVSMHIRYTLDKRNYRRWKKLSVVKERFSLK